MIFAANLGVPAHRPVILPGGLSGHERIRADPAFHTWAQTIASEDAGTAACPSFSTGRAPSCIRSPTPHDFGPPCLVRVERRRRQNVVADAAAENTVETPSRRPDVRPAGPAPDARHGPRAARHPPPVRHPDLRAPRRPRGPGRAGQGRDRFGQDPRLRPAAARPHRRRGQERPPRPARAGARADPRAGPAGARQPGPPRPGHRRAAGHRLRRCPHVPPDPAAAPRRRRHHRHPGPAAGPDQPGRGHPRRGRRHRPGRGRLHGRPRLPAGGQGAARPDRPQRPAAAVLGDAGRRGRLAWSAAT